MKIKKELVLICFSLATLAGCAHTQPPTNNLLANKGAACKYNGIYYADKERICIATGVGGSSLMCENGAWVQMGYCIPH